MNDASDHRAAKPQPLLLRFLTPLEPSQDTFAYDRRRHVNVLAGQSLPAVLGGLDVKTVGNIAED